MIHWLAYIDFQHLFSSQNVLVVFNVVLQLLKSVFLKEMLCFRFLSLVAIWTTVALIAMKKINGYKRLFVDIGYFQQKQISVFYRLK